MHYFPLFLLSINIVIITISIFTENVAYALMSGIASIFLLRVARAMRTDSILALLKPDILLFTAFVIYGIPPAMDVATGYNSLQLDRTAFEIYLFLMFIFTLGVMLGSRGLEKMPPPSLEAKPKIASERAYIPFALVLMIMGAGLYFAFVIQDFGGIGNLFAASRAEYYREQEEDGVFTAGLNFLRFGWLFLFTIHLAGPNPRVKLIYHMVGAALFCGFFLLMGERGIWVKLVVGMFFIYAYYFGFSMRWFFLICVLSILALQTFSKVRHVLDRPDENLAQAMERFSPEWFNLAGGEAGAHYTIANDILLDFTPDQLRYGKTYLDGFVNLVPAAIWPDRARYVTTPNVEYMMKYRYWLFKSGTFKAYSFVIEAFTNFWYLGAILVGFLMGWLCKWLYKTTMLDNPSALNMALYTSTFGVLLLIVRASFASAVKSLFLSSVLPFLFLMFCIMLTRSSK